MSTGNGFYAKHVPKEIVHPSDTGTPFGLVILNQPFDDFGDEVLHLWERALIRATTDGGTNRLYQFLQSHNKDPGNYVPNFINGDFDSIDENVLEFYKAKGCEIIHTPDQAHTDFTKCIEILLRKSKDRNILLNHIVVIVNTTGRFDHIMGNIETLHLVKKWTSIPVYLLSSNGLTWLLESGKHEIMIEKDILQSPCGLIPIGWPCENVTTTGLKWNLNDQRLQFGELVSTSNTYDETGVVTVATNKPLVWTMQVSR